ncbi:cell division protein FtsQ/DivIB [Facklamia miroungae]|uniref:Cell division septal protein FtsQ n=1 Tax=Facklamia miroungae TaxID=120956 RepID=A0A1G7TU58_9LACT|nr:cell division protein FtsQ/DivIB [Facklamia miroungae]NKZ29970.1 hypothetical protein [Facklamia miroungae]SDG38762.1 Cell division septal protein FtsQ [Facklamia miroungae]
MANYRLPDKRLNQQNRKTISDRQNQPITAPMGNYRLDSEGKPILPTAFNQQLSEPENNRSSKIYSLNDYRNNDQTQVVRPRANRDQPFNSSLSMNYRTDNRYNHPSDQTFNQSGQRWNQKIKKTLNGWKNTTPTSLTSNFPKGKSKIFILFIFIYTIMIWSGWQILPFDNVNTLRISGNEMVQVEAILKGVSIHSMDKVDKILKWRKDIEKHILANNPLLEDVRITRENWRALDIIVKEHQIVGIYQLNNKTYALLSNGLTSDEVLSQSQLIEAQVDRLPLVEGNYSELALKQLASALRQMDPLVLEKIARINPSSKPGKEGYIEIKMKDGNLVKAVSTTVAEKMNYYPKILDQLNDRKGIIDLEVGAYFTPDNSETNSVKLNNN